MGRLFFHIHIWKTAGTTFFNICSDNYGKKFHRDKMLIQNWFLSKDQLLWLMEYHGWIRCYSCHMLNGDLPFENDLEKEVVGIAFVRDPVDRFISSYHFQRGQNYRGGVAKEHDFDDFCKTALEDTFNPMWRNGQTYILGGKGDAEGLNKVNERIQQNNIILLPTERFDESCVLLEKLYPSDFTDCSYTRKNVSKKNTPITEEQRRRVAQWMETDLKLLELANQQLDLSLQRLFQSNSELNNYLSSFNRRCKIKKQRQRVSHLTRNLKTRIETTIGKLKKIH
jgi:predicted DNA-binding protein YlxM (UPF0122 family)